MHFLLLQKDGSLSGNFIETYIDRHKFTKILEMQIELVESTVAWVRSLREAGLALLLLSVIYAKGVRPTYFY